MSAARLHGPGDLRLETVPRPGPPGPSQVLLRILTTGICGSDLHSYEDARIGDTTVEHPFILGHEFSAVVEETGAGSVDGRFEPVRPGHPRGGRSGATVRPLRAVREGPSEPLPDLRFCGNHPDGGSLCEWMHMPARSCFPVPDALDDVEAALLEPLGVAIHAVDLARVRVSDSVAILGAGPIGLLILQVAKLAGADPVFVVGPVPLAACGRGTARRHARATARPRTRSRGFNGRRAVEAWMSPSRRRGETAPSQQACEMARLGGRVVLVGIPSDDRLTLKHSTARRKGLTILMSRRMKHTYPRAIRLVERGRVDLARPRQPSFSAGAGGRGVRLERRLRRWSGQGHG